MKNELVLMEKENFKYVAYEIDGKTRLITEMYELDNLSINHILLVKRYTCNIYFVGFNSLHYALIKLNLKREITEKEFTKINMLVSELPSEEVQNKVEESLVNKCEVILEHQKEIKQKKLKKDYYFEIKGIK